jgi:asparagine synthase (glutamine-hydrolysing)
VVPDVDGARLPADLAECTGSEVDVEEVYSEAIELWEEDGNKSDVDKVLRFYTKLYLQDDILCKVDRASMMHSLEVRAPFLDIDLVNFVRTLPGIG